MKIKRKIGIAVLIILTFLTLIIFWVGIDHGINGFVLVSGRIQLNFGNDYVKLSNEPLQILVNRGDLDLIFDDFFETFECGDAFAIGYKEGVRYHAGSRAFTRNYWIVTLKELPLIAE